jgi:hypothetical protein
MKGNVDYPLLKPRKNGKVTISYLQQSTAVSLVEVLKVLVWVETGDIYAIAR